MLTWNTVGKKVYKDITREASKDQLSAKQTILFVLTAVKHRTTLSVNVVDLTGLLDDPARSYSFDSIQDAKTFATSYRNRYWA